MAISIKHAFVSLKGDGGDATVVRPSNWNAEHSTSIGTQKIVGRQTAGVGAFEEITLTTYMASLLAAVDGATLAGLIGLFETGDVKYTFKTAASAGWMLVAAAGTIGNAGSGATLRANADVAPLYALVWGACSDTLAPVSGGRGANAAADFSALKPMTIPQLVGRGPIGAGSAGGGTSARTLGAGVGSETATLVTGNLPPYTPAGTIVSTVNSDPGQKRLISSNAAGPLGYGGTSSGGQISSVDATVTSAFTGTAQGGISTPVGIIQPSIPLNVMVKL